MSKERLNCEDICPNHYSSWEEGTCMECCEIYNRGECPVVYVNDLEKQIADLEAKLAEEDKKILELQEDSIRVNQIYNEELAEKDNEIEKYKQLCTISKLEDLQIENMLLKGKAQDKISFAVELLEKVKNKFNGKRPIDDLANGVGLELGYTTTQIQNYIDNQIKQLKEKNNG